MEISGYFVALAKTGISGFALYTCYLSFKLIRESNESSNHRLIYGYMGFSLLLALVVLTWQVLDTTETGIASVQTCPEKDDCIDVDDDFFHAQNIQVFKEGEFSDFTVPGLIDFPYSIYAASEKLHHGYKPKYIIRFIDGDRITANGISNGKAWLGDPAKKVIFAADYDELKGLPVNEALDRIGGIPVGSSVVAVIVDTSLNGEVTINPASIRGIYKWIRDLNAGNEVNPKIAMPSDAALLDDIQNNNGIRYHGLLSWEGLYNDYERAFMNIRDSSEFMSSFSGINKYDEWDGRGFSNAKSGSGKSILIADTHVLNYGALGFLVRNVPLRNLRSVKIVRLDSSDPNEIIPVLKNSLYQ